MTELLGGAGRAFLKDFFVALLVLGAGIWAAPDYNQAFLIAVTAVVGATRAGIKAVTVFFPQLTLERILGQRGGFVGKYAYVGDALIQSSLAALAALGLGLADYFIAGDATIEGAKLLATTAILAFGSGVVTIIQGALTKGTYPAPATALPGTAPTASTPPQ